MAIVLDGDHLTVDQVVAIARGNETVEIASEARERINACRGFLEKRIEAREIMYGVNTGIGEFSEVVLTDEQVKQFQKYLIYNHAAGIGDPLPVEVVRAAMASRINVHCHGHSGCRLAITETLQSMLNKGVTPVVCEKGSVGACGDLAPMSQIALVVMGEGEAFYKGERLHGAEALKRAGIEPCPFQARDGLSIINGSNIIAGMGSLQIHDAEQWLKQAEIACAMTLESLMANLKPYDVRLHRLRGFPGAVVSAENLSRIMDGSDLKKGMKVRVQDAYSMRSSPQVLGAARDQLRWTRAQFEIELNGVGDNPVFLPADEVVLTGANFQGSPISMPLDMAGAAVCMACVMSERRLNRLLNPALSEGLPAFLTKGAGMFSGLMLSQYTAGMQIVEERILSTPSCVQSIPAAADQEDFVSMGMNGALKTRQILDNACGVLGIEMMAGAQAIDFRDYKVGRGTQAAHDAVREVVEHLDEDRPLFPDHNAMKQAVADRKVLEAVEAEIGELKCY